MPEPQFFAGRERVPWAHTSRLPSVESRRPSVASDISKSAVINCPHFTRRFEKKEEKAERAGDGASERGWRSRTAEGGKAVLVARGPLNRLSARNGTCFEVHNSYWHDLIPPKHMLLLFQ